MDLRAVFDDLVRLETMLWNGIDAQLREHRQLSLGSFEVLRVVDSVRECRVQDVADALAITVGGASQAVDRLVAQGHGERRAHPTDRRSSIVALTPAGLVALEAASAVVDRELDARLRAPLTSGALAGLGSTLRVLRQAADA